MLGQARTWICSRGRSLRRGRRRGLPAKLLLAFPPEGREGGPARVFAHGVGNRSPPRAYIQIYQRLPLGLGQVNIRRCLRDVRGRPGSRETMVHRGLYEEVWVQINRAAGCSCVVAETGWRET